MLRPFRRRIRYMMRYRKCAVATLLILGSSYGRISGRTPSWIGTRGGHQQSSQRRPFKSLNDTPEASAERVAHGQGTAEPGQRRGEAPCPRPSRIYRILARHLVGRYVLATSSLVGECARVYVPAPLGLIALTLCGQVGIALGSDGRHRGDSGGGEGSQRGLSYEQFLPQHHSVEYEELSVEAVAVPQEKYGRVSSAFIARHAIGRVEDSKEDVSDERTTFVAPTPGVRDSSEDCVQDPHERTSVKIAGQSPPSLSESRFLKSFVGLRKEKPRGAGDDLDLLSDVDDFVDDVDVSNVVVGAKSGGGEGVLVAGNCDVSPERMRLSRSESDPKLMSRPDPRCGGGITHVAATGSRSSASARNLVSSADDSATALISKLRRSARKKSESGALKAKRIGRTPKSRRSSEAPDK